VGNTECDTCTVAWLALREGPSPQNREAGLHLPPRYWPPPDLARWSWVLDRR